MQSSLLTSDPQPAETAAGLPAGRALSTAEWLDYFRANAGRGRPVPWGHAGLTDAERDAVGRSLQAWQLGETSDGRHLRAAAARHAARTADPEFPALVDLFIQEEQRHGEM